jgi:hypothetical protein
MAEIFPLQHYLVIIRNVMVQGAGLGAVWVQVAALVGLGVRSTLVESTGYRRETCLLPIQTTYWSGVDVIRRALRFICMSH